MFKTTDKTNSKFDLKIKQPLNIKCKKNTQHNYLVHTPLL